MSALSVGSTTPDTESTGGAAAADDADSGPGAKFVKWIPGDALTFYAGLLGLEAATGDNPSIELPTDPTPTDTQASTSAATELSKDQIRDIDASSFGWFLFALAAAVVLVVGGANTKGKRKRRTDQQRRIHRRALVVRCGLTAIAFAVWASLIPKAWPNNFEFVQDMGPAYPLVIPVVGAVFTFVAELATKRATS